MSSPPHPQLAARTRRIARLRRRVVAATLTTFALAWGVIAWHGDMGTTTKAVPVARVSATATATPTAAATATPTATATATPTATATQDLTTSQS
jgi:hypothetical protein